ncbi:AMP-binding protein [Actinomarinicola tropica]|uniref:AMP-binding protein n=1 Tax=Actinomarinicola tropica TaxID=2789776 RepID=A0A5Q2RLK0_9ACTN|nr:AMP-binding protein [Actinomarinicola tropica]QGG96354.1 AMP-binding protein [Actinomarinicola tropica]
MSEMPIGTAVGWLAARHPDRPAITHEDRTVTWQELDRATNRLARAYEAMGVGQDDLVTIGLPNGIEFYEACIATWKLGATPQPVSARLPFREREAIVELVDPPIVVGVEPGAHGSRRCLPPGFSPDPALADGPLPERTASALKAPTSGGSTGRPKIIVSGAAGVTDPEQPRPFGQGLGGVQLVPGPLYHNAPFMFSMNGLFTGAHLIVMTRFDAAECLRLVEEHRVTWMLLVPTMMHRIWRLPEDVRTGRDVSSLEGILHLGAPCPPWLKREWIGWLGPERVWELYAGTEAQGVTIISGQEWLDHPGSVGRPAPCSMKICDDDGHELPPGEVGELWMRIDPDRPRTYRYIGAEARSRDGWESLGDMGAIDEDGYLYLADRMKDMILTGGSNVYPAEVEAALDEHPAVSSCAVIGLPDEDLGNVVHAVVHLDPSAPEPSDDDLRAFLAERLVRYKIPRSFERVDVPVRDDAGKVRRSALQADRAG